MEAQLKTTTTTSSALTESVNTSKPSVVQFTIDEQCPIQYVTVYNDRAEVTRLLKTSFRCRGCL